MGLATFTRNFNAYHEIGGEETAMLTRTSWQTRNCAKNTYLIRKRRLKIKNNLEVFFKEYDSQLISTTIKTAVNLNQTVLAPGCSGTNMIFLFAS